MSWSAFGRGWAAGGGGHGAKQIKCRTSSAIISSLVLVCVGYHTCLGFMSSVFRVAFQGEIEKDEAERLGLVPSHAYAVLDVKEINGTRLLQVGRGGVGWSTTAAVNCRVLMFRNVPLVVAGVKNLPSCFLSIFARRLFRPPLHLLIRGAMPVAPRHRALYRQAADAECPYSSTSTHQHPPAPTSATGTHEHPCGRFVGLEGRAPLKGRGDDQCSRDTAMYCCYAMLSPQCATCGSPRGIVSVTFHRTQRQKPRS